MPKSWFMWLEGQARSDASEQSWLFAFFTSPLACVFFVITTIRNWLFDIGLRRPMYLPGRVISVGNIVAGGTGKTPSIAALTRALIDAQQQPAIMTRGYGSGLASGRSIVMLAGRVIYDTHPSAGDFFADEARMLSTELPTVPVFIGRDRERMALRTAVSANVQPTCWLVDDAFQRRQLARDLDIVVLDSTRPFGNSWLLPRGVLREPIRSLRRANVFLLVSGNPDSTYSKLPHASPNALVLQAEPKFGALLEVCPTQLVPAKNVPQRMVAVTAIARPERFFDALRARGYEMKDHVAYPDHQRFPREHLKKLAHTGASIVTTAKDYYREPEAFVHLATSVYVLPMVMHFDAQAIISVLLNHKKAV